MIQFNSDILTLAIGLLAVILILLNHEREIKKFKKESDELDKHYEELIRSLDKMRFSDEFLSKVVESNYSEDITYTALKIKKNFHDIGERQGLELDLLKMLVEHKVMNKPRKQKVPVPMPSVTETVDIYNGTHESEIKWNGKKYSSQEEAMKAREQYINSKYINSKEKEEVK